MSVLDSILLKQINSCCNGPTKLEALLDADDKEAEDVVPADAPLKLEAPPQKSMPSPQVEKSSGVVPEETQMKACKPPVSKEEKSSAESKNTSKETGRPKQTSTSDKVAATAATNSPTTVAGAAAENKPATANSRAPPKPKAKSSGKAAPKDIATKLAELEAKQAAAAAVPKRKTAVATDDDPQAEHSCPGMKMAGKLTPLQKIKQERLRIEAKQNELRQTVDDMLSGKLAKEGGGGGQPGGNMLIRTPTPYERTNTKRMMLEQFRVQYRKFSKSDDRAKAATEQYSEQETAGLAIQGGHQPMPRPKNVKVPKDFRKPLQGGVINAKTLAKHDCEAERILVSVYGDVFDVSDRPDKYGKDGPYSWMSGHDLTWGFVSGKDIPEQNDYFYDMWKIAPEEFREKKLQGLLAWVAFYEHEYGQPVGRLEEYQKEAGLKGPPMEEANECSIM